MGAYDRDGSFIYGRNSAYRFSISGSAAALAVLIIGLGLSVMLMGVAATYIARLLHSRRWIAYAGCS